MKGRVLVLIRYRSEKGYYEQLKVASKHLYDWIHFCTNTVSNEYGYLPLPPESDNTLHHENSDLPPPSGSERT